MIDGASIPGGHRVQLNQTARFLGELGVEAQVSFEAQAPEEAVEDFDLVHGFGLTPQWIRRCRQANVPVVLSPIYWARSYFTGQDKTYVGYGEAALNLANRMRQGGALWRDSVLRRGSEACDRKNSHVTFLRVTYEMSELLLPNSALEARAIVDDLGVTTPTHVVPNSVDAGRFMLPQNEKDRSYVLCAGRFEPHKNQLGLIRAWKSGMPPLKLVGRPHPHHPAYYAKCQREARVKGIEVLPGVEHDDLPALYHGARVHILPTWFETTGLVSLEAALCGCNIVSTSRGFAREYFEDMAWYCDPSQPETIRQAALQAWNAPPQHLLRERILNNYTWQHTASATLAGYRSVLERFSSRPDRARGAAL